ncbi:hypothetical protein V8J38_16670 (plasmid) [Brevundimonas olei]|uniref:Uncharacterized protein n=1 Tax=Brevundimonas olei TaxID=657642 RepID=A0ABZ2INN1_9CAUL
MTAVDFQTGATARLNALATAMYGEDWPGQVARLTCVNLRTCQRIKAAAIAGEEARSSYGVLLGVTARLIDLIEAADMLEDALQANAMKPHL